MSQTCKVKWGPGGYAYRCLTCQKNENACLCRGCVEGGLHQAHSVVRYRSANGGSCDCGDHRYFPKDAMCVAHGGPKERGTCGRVWAKGAQAFRCHTCEKSGNAALCCACARSPQHHGHELEAYASSFGGSCDCGDARFYDTPGCEAHSDKPKVKDVPPPQPVEKAMTAMTLARKPKVFFSYCWDDKDLVRPLAEATNAFADVWLDVDKLKGGHLLYHEIVGAINDSDVVVVCISTSYLKSVNCEKEILLAGDWKKTLLPIRLPDVSPWPPIHGMAVHLAGKLYVEIVGGKHTQDHLDQIKGIAEQAVAQ